MFELILALLLRKLIRTPRQLGQEVAVYRYDIGKEEMKQNEFKKTKLRRINWNIQSIQERCSHVRNMLKMRRWMQRRLRNLVIII